MEDNFVLQLLQAASLLHQYKVGYY